MIFLKYNEKKNFINRLKYAVQKGFCICIEVYQLYEVDECDKIFEVLSILKNKKLKINKTLIEICKDLIKNPDFEQNYCSRTSVGLCKRGYENLGLLKWLVYLN